MWGPVQFHNRSVRKRPRVSFSNFVGRRHVAERGQQPSLHSEGRSRPRAQHEHRRRRTRTVRPEAPSNLQLIASDLPTFQTALERGRFFFAVRECETPRKGSGIRSGRGHESKPPRLRQRKALGLVASSTT